MIIIKSFGVDPYVAGAYSKRYIPLVKERFHIEDDIVVIAPDEYIYHDGVEQTSWQAILEVIISPKYRPIEADLAHALISYLTVEIVNVRLYFTYVEDERVYKFENKDYPKFVVDKEGKEEVDLEPFEGDLFADFEERAYASGHNIDHDHHDHDHNHDDDEFN